MYVIFAGHISAYRQMQTNEQYYSCDNNKAAIVAPITKWEDLAVKPAPELVKSAPEFLWDKGWLEGVLGWLDGTVLKQYYQII